MTKLTFEQAINQVTDEHGLGSDLEKQEQIIKRFHNIPFYRWDLPVEKHYRMYKAGECKCYYCQVKWARKNNYEYPLFDYEQNYLSALTRHHLVACIKSRASGISEVTLRFMEWLALKDRKLAGSQMIIVSSAAEEQTLSFMRRIRAHLEPIFGTFSSREKTILLNGVRIQTVPPHNLLQIRGQTGVSVLVLEESSFWHPNEEREILPIILPLRQKNKDIMISLISTPGRIGSLMHQIHLSPQDKTPFYKVYVPYSDVIGKLFTKEEIEEQRQTNAAFEREFNLVFGFGISGGVFSPVDIQRAIDQGKAFSAANNKDPTKQYPNVIYADNQGVAIGVDVGAADSKTAITGVQILPVDKKVHVFASESYSRANEDFLINRILELWNATNNRRTNIFCDAANVSFIKRLKSKLSTRYNNTSDQVDYEQQIAYIRHETAGTNWLGAQEEKLGQFMIVVPVSFSKHGARLLQTLSVYLQRNWLAIHPKFQDLIFDLQAARVKENVVNSDWSLQKDNSQLRMDALDSLRLCMYPMVITNTKTNNNNNNNNGNEDIVVVSKKK